MEYVIRRNDFEMFYDTLNTGNLYLPFSWSFVFIQYLRGTFFRQGGKEVVEEERKPPRKEEEIPLVNHTTLKGKLQE